MFPIARRIPGLSGNSYGSTQEFRSTFSEWEPNNRPSSDGIFALLISNTKRRKPLNVIPYCIALHCSAWVGPVKPPERSCKFGGFLSTHLDFSCFALCASIKMLAMTYTFLRVYFCCKLKVCSLTRCGSYYVAFEAFQ